MSVGNQTENKGLTMKERGRERKRETFEGVVPESLGSLVLKTLEMALPSRRRVLELLVAVVTVILSQWHIFLNQTPRVLLCFDRK